MNTSIVESGGTKSTWIFNDPHGKPRSFQTVGLHPFELTEAKKQNILSQLKQNDFPLDHPLYFYGAGCESLVGKQNISELLVQIGLKKHHINTDLLGACIACWGNENGVTGILGTGAITAEFDGNKILQTKSGLGYLLGDEGSGFDIGKRLLNHYFNDQLSKEIRLDIEHYFNGADQILPKIYLENGRFIIAGLTKIVKSNEQNPTVKALLNEAFHDFYKTAIEPLKTSSIKIVGSIGYHFKEPLTDSLAQKNISVTEVFQDAAAPLFDWHNKSK